ncbi:cytochrome P450 [Dactylosporangium sp. AC04546]|uniref:cytochrome P450 family protein n=1 Tax=Dactylosporangium sp. AC04546 TaxID=2862460 RepID=UPI001EDD2E22|nr:cytochrome P450 [Dactylosporangium sp. AC04546]WVK86672.1 cytochrome P450 [Dactylosporangium sp. AC04546]
MQEPSPFEATTSAERHARYAQIRDAAPVRRISLPGGAEGWLVTSHDLVHRALTDPRLAKGGMVRADIPAGRLSPATLAAINTHMLNVDPPEHTRLRRLVSRVFTARRVEALRPQVQQIADRLLDDLSRHETVDLLDAYAVPLPVEVICQLLGIGNEHRDQLRSWATVVMTGAYAPDDYVRAITEWSDFIRDLLAQKRRMPGDDLLSDLVEARYEQDALSDDELTSTAYLMMIAGFDTTTNLIANGAWLLLTHPDQRALLAREPRLLDGAVEEFLRYESPVQNSSIRTAREPIELDGHRVAAGDIVLLSLLAANRDPVAFADANGLDIARPRNPHVAFGHGPHFCLGAPLARIEGQIALRVLFGRYPDLRLAVDPAELRWRVGFAAHALAALPVRPGTPAAANLVAVTPETGSHP